MLDLFIKGGILMYPLFFLSVVSLALFLERLYTLRISQHIFPDFSLQLKKYLLAKDYNKALLYCQKKSTGVSRICFSIINNRSYSFERLLSLAEDKGRREALLLDRYQETMSLIVSLSPLLGLLGTVFGMIRIFGALAGSNFTDASLLSGGISEALITTAVGLCVAIPTQFFLYIVRQKSEKIVTYLESETNDILYTLSSTEEKK